MSKKRRFEELENTEYIYQKANFYPYHCGPFALYNLLLKNNKYIGLHKLINLCEPEPINGTSNKNFNKAIDILNRQFDINIIETESSLNNIYNIIQLNKQIIILFHWTHHFHKGEHYALIEKIDGNNNFKFINYSFDEPIKLVGLRELKNMLRYYKSNEDICPTLWYIK